MKKFLFITFSLISFGIHAGLEEGILAYQSQKYAIALEEFSYLADEGNASALFYVGKIYNDGEGVSQDKSRALSFFQKAAALGHADALYHLGMAYLTGENGLAQDKETAISYFKKAAYAGNANALYQLAELEATNTEDSFADLNRAFGFYLMAAQRGQSKAQYKLGFMFLNGRGIPQNDKSAIYWLRKSASQGYVLAQKELADLASKGGRFHNSLEAYSWYSIIAAYNVDEIGTEAQEERDKILSSVQGENLPRYLARQRNIGLWKPQKPEKLFTEKERLNFSTPVIPDFNDPLTEQQQIENNELIVLNGYKYGITPERLQIALDTNDLSQIERDLEKYGSRDHPQAYSFLGDIMMHYVEDKSIAVDFYEKAAKMGVPYAQYRLAQAYCEGIGVPRADVPTCYAWALKANEKPPESLKKPIQSLLLFIKNSGLDIEKKEGQKTYEELKTSSPKTKKGNSSDSDFSFF